MPRPYKLAFAALLAALLSASVLAPAALASHTQSTFFEAPGMLLNPATRPNAVATLRRLGVNAIRVELSWHTVAPSANSVRRPAFDATDPSRYDWAAYDPLIEEAHRLGWQVLLTVTSPVPRWATAEPRHDSLVTHPDPRQFQSFMTAVARHYGQEVSLFSIWNEPNHHEFLEPQFNRDGSPASPRIYRALYQAGYAGLQAGGIAHPRVLIGETAPEGETHPRTPVRAHSGYNMSPLLFLRATLCLDASYRRSRSCGSLPTSGWGVHPYSSAAGPFFVPRDPETVTIGTLSRITRALDRAARAGAVPAHLPVYVTEFGVMSKPNRYQGVPLATQAEYDAIDEHIAYANPRVASFSQYLLRDDPPRGHKVVFQTGLMFANGKAKPLLAGFPLPLTVTRHGRSYSLWGFVRPAHEATLVTVEAERPGSHRFGVLTRVQTDARGYWTLASSVAAKSWRVHWVSAQGASYTGPPIRAY